MIPIDPLLQRALVELQRDFGAFLDNAPGPFVAKQDVTAFYETLVVLAKAAVAAPRAKEPK